MEQVSKDAVGRLIEVLQELIKDKKFSRRDFEERALRVKLARGVTSPSDEEYDYLVSTIFVPDEEVGRGGAV